MWALQTALSTSSETHRNAAKDPSLDGMCDSDTGQAEPGVPPPTPLAGISLVLLSPLLFLSFIPPAKGWGFSVASPAPVIINSPQQ